jgi:hypothetical protein
MTETQIFVEMRGVLGVFVAYQALYDAVENMWVAAFLTGNTGSGNTDDEYVCIKWGADDGGPVLGITAE